MKRDVAEFVSRCLVCQQVKAEHLRPSGLLQPLPVPEWKWEHIAMDFVTGFPRSSKGSNAIWVVVDRLTKSAHFIPFRVGQSTEVLARKYLDQIVRLHGVPISIVSDRDTRFTSAFWQSLQRHLGTSLSFSSAYHPQSDGQSERTIQTLEDLLRSCALDFGGSWEDHLSLVEFAYNNSFHASIGMAPFEALYGRRCRSAVAWDEVGDRQLLGPDFVVQAAEVVQRVRRQLLAVQSRQKSWADSKRRPLSFSVGDRVFLRVSPMKGIMRFGVRGKLSPRFVGPFRILRRIGTVAYQLDLPSSLSGVHDVFHVSQLRRYIADPRHVIDTDSLVLQEDLSYTVDPVQIVDRTEKQLRGRTVRLVRVCWDPSSPTETSWEREEEIRSQYPHLFRS